MPQLRAEQLPNHLQKTLAPVYVIHGDEPLISLESADAIRAAARAKGFTEREVLIAERSFDWSELRAAGAGGSLFGDRKIVELRIPTGKPGTQGAEAIEKYVARLDPDAVTIVSLPRLDRAGQSSGWFGALAAAGVVVEVWPVDRAKLPEWIAGRLARQKQKASRDVLEFLADRVEGNLLAAHQEVQKLALLAPEGVLGAEVVESVVARVARYTPQDASAALLAGDTVRYLRVVDGLEGEGEAPTLLLWVISEDIRALLGLERGRAGGKSRDTLLRELRVWGPRQAVVGAATGRFRIEALEQALLDCGLIDRAVKGVRRRNPWEEFAKLALSLRPASAPAVARDRPAHSGRVAPAGRPPAAPGPR